MEILKIEKNKLKRYLNKYEYNLNNYIIFDNDLITKNKEFLLATFGQQ